MPPPALIETIRVRGGTAPLWGLHLQRLSTSCRDLGIPYPDLIPPTGGPDRIHRLEVSGSGVSVTQRAIGSTDPIRLVTSPVVHLPYRHKVTEREVFDRALAQARSVGADDGLLFTAEGLLAEASIWSVFWWDGARLCAPALDLGVLPGVARARLAVIGGKIEERRVRKGDLTAVPVFLANAARGIVEVRNWEGLAVPAQADTAHLKEAFWP